MTSTLRKRRKNIATTILVIVILGLLFLASFKGFIFLKSLRHQNDIQDADKVYVRLNEKIVLEDAYHNQYNYVYYTPLDVYIFELPEGETMYYQCEGQSTTIGTFVVNGTETTILLFGIDSKVKYQELEIC
jgi:hypothetical protein